MVVFSNQIVRLDTSVKSLEICDTDWAIDTDEHVMQHFPTRTMFEIEIKKKETEGEPLTSMDFSSRLVAIGAPCELPPPDAIDRLGREALVLYLTAFGYMQQKDERDMAAPDGLIRNAYLC